jgi:hypothetical protein
MSRWFGTSCRKLYYISRFVNWDLHQDFHIQMAIIALFFSSLHAIAHLSGTFFHASRAAHQASVDILLGNSSSPRSYLFFLRLLPGWTGLAALGLFWTITILSLPWIRRYSYEIFQFGHLLMFPMLGLLFAHGATRLLQYPMLGFWLALPTLLVVFERCHRVYRGYRRIPASIKLLDNDTVTLICRNPSGKPWKYSAGQFVFLQVPSISWFQWHPFTISTCIDQTFQLHIKNAGDFTARLRDLPKGQEFFVGIDGPFGAPAQRFYEYDRALIIGAGVGITPFSAILTDLEHHISAEEDPWLLNRIQKISTRTKTSRDTSRATSIARPSPIRTDTQGTTASSPTTLTSIDNQIPGIDYRGRRVDFHWLVREKNHLLWFSDLLNRAVDFSSNTPRGTLDLNIHTHITMKRSKVSTHVFLYLFDAYRTPTVRVSALTGLRSRSEFGRPDFESILGKFHDDVSRGITEGTLPKGEKIAVFFCGSPVIGLVLSDLCEQLSFKGRTDGTGMRWDFRMEVFG